VSVVYDAGALIAAERSDRAVWADHRVRLEIGLVPVTTAPIIAQVGRPERQAQLRRFCVAARSFHSLATRLTRSVPWPAGPA
jgi:hypothetical protein